MGGDERTKHRIEIADLVAQYVDALLGEGKLYKVLHKVFALASRPNALHELLASLPPLPEEIEYRFVGKHLILRDAKANLIIDYIPNAIS